jgi:hypothetical protein
MQLPDAGGSLCSALSHRGTALAEPQAMEWQAARTHMGPFKMVGDTAWLVPCGGIVLFTAVFASAWIMTNVLVSRPLLCDLETNYVTVLGAAMGVGVGCLVAAVFDDPRAQVLSLLASGVMATLGEAALVMWLLSNQCTSFRMFVHQLIGV